MGRACRIYAPVGPHETLFAYLVRRLLENGTNTSFVRQITDSDIDIAELTRDPVASAMQTGGTMLQPAVREAQVLRRLDGVRRTLRAGVVADGVVLIADGSASVEQVIVDTLEGAFSRKSYSLPSLRLLCLHESIAARLLDLLGSALHERNVGMMDDTSTDIGPRPDGAARKYFERYVESMQREGFRVVQAHSGPLRAGNFVAPTLIDLGSHTALGRLQEAVEGPLVHVVQWRTAELDDLMRAINEHVTPQALAVYTRLEQTMEHVLSMSGLDAIDINCVAAS